MTRLMEHAKAFAIIAPHVTDEVRRRLADHVARMMLPPVTQRDDGSRPLAGLETHRPEYELAEHDPVVKFLTGRGFAEGELVGASARLWAAVRADRENREVAALTGAYLAALWDRIAGEATPNVA